MNLSSAIYLGHVRHRRRQPAHAFTFPMFMVYLDLRELDKVFSMSRLWGRSRWCPARFRSEDYLNRRGLDLDESVRIAVEEALGRRPSGPIRMLTHLRYFGHIFNPVTFYYCFDAEEGLDAIVAEITNTPWKERHTYILDAHAARRNGAGGLRWRFDKDFHISPFLPMDVEYDWAFTPPGQSLFVQMNLRGSQGGRAFDATLRMHRREITPGVLRALLVRYPLMTVQLIAAIHFQALKLWLKGARIHRHLGKALVPDHGPQP